MEEFIQDLKEYSEKTLFPMELPTEDDLLEVEEQIFLPIPKEYRQFLLLASNLTLGSMEPATASDPQSHTYIPELTAQAWDNGLPRDVFPICSFIDQYYCINPTGGILLWANGNYIENEEWEDIWDWAKKVWLKAGMQNKKRL